MVRLLPLLVLAALLAAPGYAADPEPTGLQFFEQRVQPLLAEHCNKCHGGDKAKGGLSLAGRESVLRGGDSGPAVDLQDPSASLLLEALNFSGLEMPPSGKLSDAEIATFRKWIELGLPMPEGGGAPAAAAHGVPRVNDETRNHWSFRRLQRPVVPAVDRQEWIRNPIDAFVLARLEAAGLQPSTPAPPQQLARRLHYDLVGLPPDLSWVQAYEQQPTDTAYQGMIDGLLNSPHHGEHFARYWLDLVRYGETNSFERDNPKPFVWRYRDYVIDFFNSRKGYDQFILEQLAGDELDRVTRQSIIATGYYRLGLWDDEPADPELAFFDGIDDLVGTTSQAFLGLTLNCARCHDHKLDPLPQADYYRFAAFFRNIQHYGKRSDESVHQASVGSIANAEEETAHQAEKIAWEKEVAGLRQQLDDIEARVRPQLQGGERDDFEHDSQRQRVIEAHAGEFLSRDEVKAYVGARKKWSRLRNQPPRSAHQALRVKERGAEPPATHVLIRGNPHAHGDVVTPQFPAVLSPPEPVIAALPDRQTSGRRRALAEWIASRDNPLTARVMVNRIWQWHFGRGLVASANDFGLQGEAPTHPELLDWLAAEFIESGWSLRHIHQLILTSNTYRMSSAPREDALAIDPQNRLLWRFDMRRLRAEELRDTLLAVTGTLNLADMYGPSITPRIEKEVLAGQSIPGYGWKVSSDEESNRRSIYIHIKRSLTVPLLANFDVAEADVTCPVRFATTQPTQALTMLNSVFLQEQSQCLAELAGKQAGDEPQAQAEWILRRVLQRQPTADEIARSVHLRSALQRDHQLSPEAALKYMCLAMLNLNEVVYLD